MLYWKKLLFCMIPSKEVKEIVNHFKIWFFLPQRTRISRKDYEPVQRMESKVPEKKRVQLIDVLNHQLYWFQ